MHFSFKLRNSINQRRVGKSKEWTNLNLEFGFGNIGAFGPDQIVRISRSSVVPPHFQVSNSKHNNTCKQHQANQNPENQTKPNPRGEEQDPGSEFAMAVRGTGIQTKYEPEARKIRT